MLQDVLDQRTCKTNFILPALMKFGLFRYFYKPLYLFIALINLKQSVERKYEIYSLIKNTKKRYNRVFLLFSQVLPTN